LQYLGGKAYLRDEICAVINSIDAQIYVEPFCGACWVGEKVNKPHRILSDANYYLIEMWKALQKGWIPPNVAPSEEEYKRIRDDPTVSAELKGFIGIAQSWGGIFWGGYARGRMSDGRKRDYTRYAYNSTMRRIPNLLSVHFQHKLYSKVLSNSLKAKDPMVMYLDPPYESTTTYRGIPPFNSKLFWQNVRVVSKKHYVLTSSYKAPEDFVKVREWNPRTGMNKGNNECLFAQGLVLENYDI